ncbi:MAG TPA: VCBS repeat-containing protein [Panacibacter sp.]|nr:VCBS repeat-containing protein [Panacibacter sp.]HNP43978.1 VCBS repeat-containing protein [Panacibacter sp.]
MKNKYRSKAFLLLPLLCCATLPGHAQVKFIKHVVSSRFVSEGAAAGDVNHDGKTDILAGNYWYEAPEWKSHMLHADTLNAVPQYSTTFLNYCMDVNNDGWDDLIRFDQPGGICVWYENPKNKDGLWKGRLIMASAGIENPAFVDVDKDGRNDIICSDAAAKQVVWLKSPTGRNDTAWQRFVISHVKDLATDRYTHGLGWGDMNKDGFNDVIIKSGWWQSPVNVKEADWVFHPADLGKDCANMIVFDADEDGDADVISSSTHDYGIWWHEQSPGGDGNPRWHTHEISRLFSQSHGLIVADINDDGHPDLITGKRFRAHNDGDPGAADAAVLYWFEYIPGKTPQWKPHLIDDSSGIGLSFVVKDVNHDGRPDIIISNKKGVFFFEQAKK